MWDSTNGFKNLAVLYDLAEAAHDYENTISLSKIGVYTGLSCLSKHSTGTKYVTNTYLDLQFPAQDLRHWHQNDSTFIGAYQYTIQSSKHEESNVLHPSYKAFPEDTNLIKATEQLRHIRLLYTKEANSFLEYAKVNNQRRFLAYTFVNRQQNYLCRLKRVAIIRGSVETESFTLNDMAIFVKRCGVINLDKYSNQHIYRTRELFGVDFQFSRWATTCFTLYQPL